MSCNVNEKSRFQNNLSKQKMAEDEKKDDSLRQFVEDACKRQALEVSWYLIRKLCSDVPCFKI